MSKMSADWMIGDRWLISIFAFVANPRSYPKSVTVWDWNPEIWWWIITFPTKPLISWGCRERLWALSFATACRKRRECGHDLGDSGTSEDDQWDILLVMILRDYWDMFWRVNLKVIYGKIWIYVRFFCWYDWWILMDTDGKSVVWWKHQSVLQVLQC